MKFYGILLYNNRGEYCGHHSIAIADDENIHDHKGDNDRANEISESDWKAQPAFYRVATGAAKKEFAAQGVLA